MVGFGVRADAELADVPLWVRIEVGLLLVVRHEQT